MTAFVRYRKSFSSFGPSCS